MNIGYARVSTDEQNLDLQRAARERGVRILWWFGLNVNDLSEQAKATMRGWVNEAKATLS